MAQKIFDQNTQGGNIRGFTNAGTWADLRNNPAVQNTPSPEVNSFSLEAWHLENSWALRRVLVAWDTSWLNDKALTITGFKVRINKDSLGGNIDTTQIHVVACDWDGVDDIVAGDVQPVTFSSLGSVNFADVGSNTDITVSDLDLVNKTGITKLALITTQDLNNSEPSGVTNSISLTTTIQAVVDYIPLAHEQVSSAKASIVVTRTKAVSAKADVKNAYSKNTFSKARITTAEGNHFAKADILITGITKAISTRSFIRSVIKEKRYKYLVYDDVTFVSTWAEEVLSEPSFRMVINGGPGEMVVKLDRSFDDFGEDVDIKLFNRVKVYCYDVDAPGGVLLFDGYISGYRPILNEHQEYLEVTLLHYTAEMSQIMLRNGSSTEVAQLSTDPSDMIKNIINYYRLDGGILSYTDSSIDDTGTVASYTFSAYTIKEALDKAVELTPVDWYWRVDPDTTIHLHQSNMAVANHSFSIGTDIISMEIWRRGEDMVNTVYFFGQESAGVPMYRVYTNSGSVTTYGIHAIKEVDQRVSLTSTADIIANRIINTKKDPEIRTLITILDNNGQNKDLGYDIESILPGQTMVIRNIKQGVKGISFWDQAQWDVEVWDQTLSYAAASVVQIQAVEYNPNYVRIEASSRLPEISKRMEEIYRNLEESQTWNAPATPDAG